MKTRSYSSASDSSEENTSEHGQGRSKREKMKVVGTTDPFIYMEKQVSNK